MSTQVNPLYSSQVPTNPTGQQVAVPGSSSSSGSNPLMPAMGTSSSAPTSTNPMTAGFPSTPTFGANTGGGYSTGSLTTPVPGATTNVGQAQQSPIGGMSTMDSKDMGTLFNSLRNTYGDGMAHTLLNFLTSGAGFNQQAVNNVLAALQPGIERGTESMMNQFSATGNRFGSGAQIGLGDYLSQVNLNEGQIETQMYEQGVSNYINTLMGIAPAVGQEKQNSPSAWDYAQQAANFAEGLMSGGMVGGGGGKKNVAVPGGGVPDTSSVGTGGATDTMINSGVFGNAPGMTYGMPSWTDTV